MTIGPEYIKESMKHLTLGTKVTLATIFLGATKVVLKNTGTDLPMVSEDLINHIGVAFGVWGIIKFCCAYAPLPKEPEEYMLTDAKRFKREGITEILLSLSSLVINNKDIMLNLFK